MPLNGGNYVAPKWVDNAAPALDAKELQAMCDSIVKNQTEAKKVPGLQSLINGRAQVQVVTYVGTGRYGADNPCSITFQFAPKVIFFVAEFNTTLWTSPYTGNHSLPASAFSLSYSTQAYFDNGGSGKRYGKRSSDGKTFFWYADEPYPEFQLNRNRHTYCFLGIG